MNMPSRIPPKSGTYPAAYVVAKHKDFAGSPVTFRKPPGAGTAIVDRIGPGLIIARDDNGGIFNIAEENGWHSNVSPAGTEWNADGWENLHQVNQRYYDNFYDVLDEAIGENIIKSSTISIGNYREESTNLGNGEYKNIHYYKGDNIDYYNLSKKLDVIKHIFKYKLSQNSLLNKGIVFGFDSLDFFCFNGMFKKNKIKVTEQEWIELLKTTKL